MSFKGLSCLNPDVPQHMFAYAWILGQEIGRTQINKLTSMDYILGGKKLPRGDPSVHFTFHQFSLVRGTELLILDKFHLILSVNAKTWVLFLLMFIKMQHVLNYFGDKVLRE